MNNSGQIIKSRVTDNFTVLPNEILQSTELTLLEKGLLVTLLSCPSNWIIYKTSLHRLLNDKKVNTDKAFKGLQDKGYILSVRVIGKKNTFIGWNHLVYDKPTTENDVNPCETADKSELRISEKPEIASSDIRETGVYNKYLEEQNTDKNKILTENNSGPSEPVADSLHIKIKKEFMAFYEKNKGTSYYWKAIDGKKTNSVISQISFKIKEKVADKEKAVVSDDSVMRGFRRLLELMKADVSPWYMLHLSMSNIDSKFNEIVALSTAPVKPKGKEEVKFTGSVPANV